MRMSARLYSALLVDHKELRVSNDSPLSMSREQDPPSVYRVNSNQCASVLDYVDVVRIGAGVRWSKFSCGSREQVFMSIDLCAWQLITTGWHNAHVIQAA